MSTIKGIFKCMLILSLVNCIKTKNIDEDKLLSKIAQLFKKNDKSDAHINRILRIGDLRQSKDIHEANYALERKKLLKIIVPHGEKLNVDIRGQALYKTLIRLHKNQNPIFIKDRNGYQIDFGKANNLRTRISYPTQLFYIHVDEGKMNKTFANFWKHVKSIYSSDAEDLTGIKIKYKAGKRSFNNYVDIIRDRSFLNVNKLVNETKKQIENNTKVVEYGNTFKDFWKKYFPSLGFNKPKNAISADTWPYIDINIQALMRRLLNIKEKSSRNSRMFLLPHKAPNRNNHFLFGARRSNTSVLRRADSGQRLYRFLMMPYGEGETLSNFCVVFIQLVNQEKQAKSLRQQRSKKLRSLSGELHDPFGPGRVPFNAARFSDTTKKPNTWRPFYPFWNYWTVRAIFHRDTMATHGKMYGGVRLVAQPNEHQYDKMLYQDECKSGLVKLGNKCVELPPH